LHFKDDSDIVCSVGTIPSTRNPSSIAIPGGTAAAKREGEGYARIAIMFDMKDILNEKRRVVCLILVIPDAQGRRG